MGDLANWELFFLFSLASSFFPSSSLPSLFPPQPRSSSVEEMCIDEINLTCSAHLPCLHSFHRISPKKKYMVYWEVVIIFHNYVVEDSWLNVFRPCSFLASASSTVPFARVISEFSRNLPGVFVFVKEVRPSQELPSQMGVECQPKHWDQSSWFLSKDSGW